MGKTLVGIFKSAPDPRSGNAKRYKLDEVLVIAILATLCDCSRFTEMELFGHEREAWLRTFLTLENGIPSHDTFGDIFAAIDPKAFQSCFMEWVQTIREKVCDEVVAVDGKTIRRSKDLPRGKRAVHIVSAWAASNGLVLGELATEEKSNEITAIPELLKILDIKGCIITIDAMGTQKDIAKTIVGGGANYVLPVKENQPDLYNDISLYFDSFKDSCPSARTSEKSHGRYETRKCYISTDIDWLWQRTLWAGLSGIAMVESSREIAGSNTTESATRFFIFSNPDTSAQKLLDSVRCHWSIENSLHWILDMDFREDESRMRLGNCAENMNVLRHLAINLLKSERSSNQSVNLKRKRCSLSRDYLLRVFAHPSSSFS